MEKPEKPIFYDHSGKRWFYTRTLTIIAFAALVAASAFLIPEMLQPAKVPAFTSDIKIYEAGTAKPQSETTRLKDRPELFLHQLVSGAQAGQPIHNPASQRALEAEIPSNLGRQTNNNVAMLTPAQIAYLPENEDLPIIGRGPLLRVVQIVREANRTLAIDPYSKEITRELNQLESQTIGKHIYALETYGETPGNKQLALTFDDGPDPVFTPKILDLLSRENVPATFFAIGANVTRHPELSRRIVQEGHTLANHSYSHADFDMINSFTAIQEINQTERAFRSVTGRSSGYFRLPYAGNDPVSFRDNLRGILEAQRLGYTVTSYQFDTKDWAFPYGASEQLPIFEGEDRIMLLHDAGGNRELTLAYLTTLIQEARAEGYTFVNLDTYYNRSNAALAPPVKAGWADHTSVLLGKIILVWPSTILRSLFLLTLFSIFISMFVNVALALMQQWQTREETARRRNYNPLVSVLIPAFNEEKVLTKTVSSVLQSYYRKLEIVIIDDGSNDETWPVMQSLQRRSSRITNLRQINQGKSVALNYGLREAKGEIIIAIDADTIFEPRTIGKLVQHFADPKIGAVAGVVKVGNMRNVITRWQALEYITSINIQRSAQAFLRAIMIVPGACGAWRKLAIEAAGGYSHATLAEDCDLTLAVRRAGYKIVQETEAISYTEAPEKWYGLAKQRFRWTFGNIQALWKHRTMFFNRKYGWLGMFVLPNTLLGILLPLIFLPFLIFITAEEIAAGQYMTLLFYALLTFIMQYFIAFMSLLVAGESFKHLLVTPVSRLIYSPLSVYLLYGSLLTALRGAHVSWNKLARTGHVVQPTEQLAAVPIPVDS